MERSQFAKAVGHLDGDSVLEAILSFDNSDLRKAVGESVGKERYVREKNQRLSLLSGRIREAVGASAELAPFPASGVVSVTADQQTWMQILDVLQSVEEHECLTANLHLNDEISLIR